MRRAFVVSLGLALAIGAAHEIATHRTAERGNKQPNAGITGTLVLGGKLASSSTMTMTGSLSVGKATGLDWDLPLATSVKVNGYTEHVDPPTFAFSVAPDSTQDLASAEGIPLKRFHWDSPPQNSDIKVTETLHLKVTTDLSPFQSSATYPLTSIPPDVAQFLKVTNQVKLPASAATLVGHLKGNYKSEQGVVVSVADWVASNTKYTPNPPRFDAASVLSSHTTNCRGYDDLMIGLLRALGIPAEVQYGWVGADRLNFPGPNRGKTFVEWSVPGSSGEFHTWLQIWFPDAGWVPFDPQREKFFVDTRHLAFFTAIDAGSDLGLGTWQAEDVPDSDSKTGQVDVIPGAAESDSKVTLNTQDSLQVSLRTIRHDVASLVMFAR